MRKGKERGWGRDGRVEERKGRSLPYK